MYRGDLITVWPHQARLATEEDLAIERKRREQAKPEGRTHGFLPYNSITLTEDVSEGERLFKAGRIGVVAEVYADSVLVNFDRTFKHDKDKIVVLPHQARLTSAEDFERERSRLDREAQPVAD